MVNQSDTNLPEFINRLEEAKEKTREIIKQELLPPLTDETDPNHPLPTIDEGTIIELEDQVIHAYENIENQLRFYSKELAWINELQQNSMDKAYDLSIAQQDYEVANQRLQAQQQEANALQQRIQEHSQELDKHKQTLVEHYNNWQAHYTSLFETKNNGGSSLGGGVLKKKTKLFSIANLNQEMNQDIDESLLQIQQLFDDGINPNTPPLPPPPPPPPLPRTTQEIRQALAEEERLKKLKDIAFLEGYHRNQTLNNLGQLGTDDAYDDFTSLEEEDSFDEDGNKIAQARVINPEEGLPSNEELETIINKAIGILKPVEINEEKLLALSLAEQAAYQEKLNQNRELLLEQAGLRQANAQPSFRPEAPPLQDFWDGVKPKHKKEPTKARLIRYQLFSYIASILLALALAFLLREYCFQITQIAGDSMSPTLMTGDRIFTSSLSYRFNQPQRGEVVVFPAPDRKDQAPYIKRIIALPGERIVISEGLVTINGRLLREDYLSNIVTLGNIDAEVPADSVFVMGDNREVSHDSRATDVSFIPIKNLTAKALWRLYPFNHMGSIYKNQTDALEAPPLTDF